MRWRCPADGGSDALITGSDNDIVLGGAAGDDIRSGADHDIVHGDNAKVSYVLDGSVRRAGDRVRITARLVDGASGGQVWAERYDRTLTDLLAVQDEIAHSTQQAVSGLM